MLSEIVARAYCPAAAPAGPDRLFSVGCQAVGSHWAPRDAADAARVSRQASAVSGTPWAPWEPDREVDGVFNDLFSPFRDESDGRLSVWVPVPVEEPLSSTLIAHDWRFFAMAWWAARKAGADPSRRILITAFDAGRRTVCAEVPAEDLYSAVSVAVGMAGGAHEVPGAACASCSRAATCRGLEAFLAEYGPMPGASRGEADELRARRLFSERASISLKLEHLEKRRDLVDSEMAKMVRDGVLRMGPDEELVVPTRTSSSYDFGMVHRALTARGLWDNSLGSIRAAELQRAAGGFPKDLARDLEKARTERTSQPSIAEAARHGRFAARAPFLGGIALQGKGGLGKGK